MVPLSPSQIKTWKLCNRKWAFQYLCGMKSIGGLAAQFGIRTHAINEGYFKTGALPTDKDTPEFRAFAVAVKHWPERELITGVEVPILAASDVSPYKGFQDLDWPGGVGDLKTTKNFAYALDEEDLTTDIQALIYLFAKITRENLGAALARWVYTTSKAPHQAMRVQKALTADQIREGIAKHVDPLASEIQRAYKLNVVTDCAPNWDSCYAFGGCQFRNLCNKNERDGLMPTAAEIIAGRKAAQTVPPPPAPEPAVVPLMEKVAAAGIVAPEAVTQEAPAAEAPKKRTRKAAEVNPPESAKVVTSAPQGFTLFMDCRAMKPRATKVVFAGELAGEANNRVKAEEHVEDYRLIDFGKGRARLDIAARQLIMEKLESGELQGASVELHRSNLIELDIMQALYDMAASVVSQ